MPKVLVLCEYASLNGGERSLLTVLEHGIAEWVEIQVAAPAKGPLAESLAALGIAHLPLDLHDARGRRLALNECRCRVRDMMRATRPDVVHANSLSMSRLSGSVSAETGVPSLGHLRDIMRLNRRMVGDLNQHTRLLAVSEATRRWYTDQGLNAQRLDVLHNGVDLERFRSRPATGYLHRGLRLPPEAMLIGAIGQIGMRKGLDLLLAAAQVVFQQTPGGHLVIIGQRYSQKQEAVDYEARLRAAALTPPLAGRVHFLGVRDDIPGLLNELTLLVHAARQEPLGRVLLEAAASGVPTIATDVGGTREIFPDATQALLVPPDDVARLAAAMQGLLDNPGTRQQLAHAARRRAEAAFSAERAAGALLDHYRRLIAPKKGDIRTG